MFEEVVILGPTERSIPLATRMGTPIPNLVENDPPAHAVSQYRQLVARYGGEWRERKPATGVYNCAGLVWASRRTCILESPAWERIIQEDGYRRLRLGEKIHPGDIAIYVDRDKNNEILHVGRVYRIKPGLAEGASPIPWVISKWNSTSGESMHQAYDVPYTRDFNFEARFYTDRPAESKR